MNNYFTEEDSKKLVNYLNFVAKRATFNNMSVQDQIDHITLLNWMQKTLLPKVESHIFEVKSIKAAAPEVVEAVKTADKKGKK